MEPIKYPNRCLRDVFGYCAKNLKGDVIHESPDQIVSYVGTTEGKCNKDPTKCKHFVTNTQANPDHPELSESKLVMKIIPSGGEEAAEQKGF